MRSVLNVEDILYVVYILCNIYVDVVLCKVLVLLDFLNINLFLLELNKILV